MSTREQYSDISRKLKSVSFKSLLAWLGIVCLVETSGCLVTDTIEFEDARNGPMQLVDFDPEATFISSKESASNEGFIVTVWDSDDQTTADQRVAAQIISFADVYENQSTGSCSLEEYSLNEDEGYGFNYEFKCNRAGDAYPVGTKITVTVRVSDRGFEKDPDDPLKTKPGAHYVDVTWIVTKID